MGGIGKTFCGTGQGFVSVAESRNNSVGELLKFALGMGANWGN